MSGAALIWSPFADADSARMVAGQLIEEKLIVCANILPGIQSVFVWDGEVGEGNEVAALLKTSDDLLDRAVARLEDIHPYETPAVIGWRCSAVGQATGAWIHAELKGKSSGGKG